MVIFSHDLWLPSYGRGNLQRRLLRWRTDKPVFTCVRRSADCDDAQAAAADDRRRRRPPSSSLKFGLLNAQSVGNKFTAICDGSRHQ